MNASARVYPDRSTTAHNSTQPPSWQSWRIKIGVGRFLQLSMYVGQTHLKKRVQKVGPANSLDRGELARRRAKALQPHHPHLHAAIDRPTDRPVFVGTPVETHVLDRLGVKLLAFAPKENLHTTHFTHASRVERHRRKERTRRCDVQRKCTTRALTRLPCLASPQAAGFRKTHTASSHLQTDTRNSDEPATAVPAAPFNKGSTVAAGFHVEVWLVTSAAIVEQKQAATRRRCIVPAKSTLRTCVPGSRKARSIAPIALCASSGVRGVMTEDRHDKDPNHY